MNGLGTVRTRLGVNEASALQIENWKAASTQTMDSNVDVKEKPEVVETK